ncbi:MAG TPA: NADH:ubiquinone reductase (Na(+)-transporting) subunit C [Candidatus Omnitrophica bacterium]|nr:NADH:ubiquinone reductase (Na(+)-transporting) subunit C [Candidatus Omnitrophota bacterium]HCI45483.1 NADH:ubiquinone reductase (Na(+)-transporting) subunit C [Candidatus Omnitrophota bacterium]
MNTSSTRYTFIFAVIVCVVSAVMLSVFSEGLRPQKELNEELDVKKNILKAVALKEPLAPKMKGGDVLEVYDSKIEELVIDKEGHVVAGKTPKQLTGKDKDLYPLYIYKEDGRVMAYAFPIVGQGLWSTLYGYLAVEADATTIRGATFYKHGETPGLGGEIEKEWFQNNFKGKTIYSVKEHKLTPVVVVKGKAADVVSKDELSHHVDGITAATLTGKGVTELIDRWVRVYDAYLSKLRKI